VIPKLLGVLIGVTLAALALSLMGQTTGQSLLSQLFTGPLSGGPDQPPAQTNESFTPAQLPAVTEKPVVTETRPARTETLSPARPNSKSPSAGGPASTKSVSPRDADRVTPRQRETSGPRQRETSGPSEATGTASRAPGASTPTNETGAPPKAGTGQGSSGGRPGLSATARPSPSAPAPSNQVASSLSPEAATPKATPFGGSHRAELVRKPVSRGRGDSYAVRLLDPAGKALVVAEVFLVVHMADGTVENIAMGALPEPGTYRATVPTGRSIPVDLRVRVSTGDRFVEVPVRP
jgi:hypothetical protein